MADGQNKDKKGAGPDIKTPNEGKKKQKPKSKSPRGQDSVKSQSPGGAAVQQETKVKRTDSKTKQSEVKKDTPGSQTENPKEMKKHSKEEIQKTTKNEVQQTKSNQKSSSVDVPGSSTDTTDGQPKSKAQLKAERRAVQEAQRAAKAQQKPGQQQVKKDKAQESKRVPDHVKADLPDTQKKVAKKLEKQQVPQRTSVQRKIKLFNHLQQYQREVSFTHINRFTSSGIHPAIIKLGLQYAEGLIVGSNARCVALLAAFKKVITDYITPPQKELCRDLDSKIKPYISFLIQCRPLSVSMGNAIKYLKWHITHTPHELSDSKAKQTLCECIDTFINERITVPAAAISTYACKKIADGDVIMVYACSSLIRHVLLDAYRQGKRFRVIVVDGRPKLEGKEMLRRLVKEGIKCTYVLINAASYVMQEATKVFLGSHALLANGCVMSRVGSSMIALIAKAYNVPTLVCCETYKFCERVQTDSFVFNELGDPNDLVKIGNKAPVLTDWKDYNSLTLLNLVYDVTPPELITAVITEFDMIPCTSVPVVLRVKHTQTSET